MKRALVTGGTRGIGRAAALALVERGAAHLVLAHRSDEASAAEAASLLRARGAAVTVVRRDLADPAAAPALVEESLGALGGLDAIVCAAGVAVEELLLTTDDAAMERAFAVNTLGAIRIVRAAAPALLRQRAGAVVLVSSVAATRPTRGQSVYAATKGALESFVRAAAVELGGKGVRVNAVAPGVVETTMTEELRALAGDALRERVALRRFARAEEIGRAIAFLCSDDASYVTGAVLPVDGGLR